MREIKFKLKDKENKNIIYVNTLQELIFEGGDISNFEIFQYTGLKDKNGKEIYEGDIIKKIKSKHSSLYGTFEIKWVRAGFYVYKEKLPITFGIKIARDCEVIGNIYED